MDSVTSGVRDMYIKYPFPDDDYKMNYGISILRYLNKLKEINGDDFFDGICILDAGCGTGNTAVALARQYPKAYVTGIDISPASLEKARGKAAKEKVRNIEFIEGSILSHGFSAKYNIIFCIGVLHHLSDPDAGLNNLNRYMTTDGIMVLWLYGRYGRNRLNANQRLLNILLGKVDSLNEKVRLTKEILRNGRQEYLECHFNVSHSAIENDWAKSRDWILGRDEWLVDQFLHVNEKVYDIDDIMRLLKNAGLYIDKWIGVDMDLAKYIPLEEVVDLFETLKCEDQYRILDALLKPNYYTIMARKEVNIKHE